MDDLLAYLFPGLVFVWLFVMGCAVGSFLNVCIYRLPRGKNLMWPSSRCGACLQPIPLYLNIPLVSWWWLRGRCRSCRAPFSMRYFWIELLTGLVVVGLYALEIGFNIHRLPIWGERGLDYLCAGIFPQHSWTFIAFHTALASLLIVATACLLEQGELPRGVVVTGAVLGLAWALLYPWPAPVQSARTDLDYQRPGFMPWPVWEPLPDWLPPGSLALGLVTGAAGILGPAWLIRLVNVFARRKSLEQAARLLLMTGGFLGWQPLVMALILAGGLRGLAALVSRSRRAPHAEVWPGLESSEAPGTATHRGFADSAPVTPSSAARLAAPTRSGGEGSQRAAFPLLLIVALVVVWLGWSWLGSLIRPWLFPGAG
jgi:leader peptidase (prepilin peptidase)/N-methyltransferase